MEKVNSFAKKRVLLAGAVVAAVALIGTKVLADDATDIESFYGGNAYAQYDNTSGAYPIITAVGSMPTNIGGHSYTGWSVFAQDLTGSLDLFISSSTLTTLTANTSAALHVGDAVNVAGQWSPYHQIPEMAFITAPASNNYFNTVSTGNTLPTPPVFTVSQITSVGSALSNHQDKAGFYLEIQNVQITGSNGFTALPGWTNGIAQETFTVTDNTGSMTMFDWTTSYSGATLLSNTPIGVANTYNAFGFLSYNTGGPLEFTPLQLVAVPEPSSVLLVGAGLAGLMALRRRRS